MALIVEDGTNVAGAESYLSEAAADTYFSKRGNAVWAALSTAKKEEALRKATDYLTQEYRLRWKGFRSYATQVLDWPRQTIIIEDGVVNSFIPVDEIPVEITSATAELALRSSSAELSPDIEKPTRSEKVGPISISYFRGGVQITEYRTVDQILRPVLKDSKVSGMAVRG